MLNEILYSQLYHFLFHSSEILTLFYGQAHKLLSNRLESLKYRQPQLFTTLVFPPFRPSTTIFYHFKMILSSTLFSCSQSIQCCIPATVHNLQVSNHSRNYDTHHKMSTKFYTMVKDGGGVMDMNSLEACFYEILFCLCLPALPCKVVSRHPPSRHHEDK